MIHLLCLCVIGGIVVVIIQVNQGKKLKKAFDTLKPVEGCTKAQVLNALGTPKQVEQNGGKEYLYWDKGKVSIQLQFEDGVCQEVIDVTEVS